MCMSTCICVYIYIYVCGYVCVFMYVYVYKIEKCKKGTTKVMAHFDLMYKIT